VRIAAAGADSRRFFRNDGTETWDKKTGHRRGERKVNCRLTQAFGKKPPRLKVAVKRGFKEQKTNGPNFVFKEEEDLSL